MDNTYKIYSKEIRKLLRIICHAHPPAVDKKYILTCPGCEWGCRINEQIMYCFRADFCHRAIIKRRKKNGN